MLRDTFVRLGAEGDPDVLESATEQHGRLQARCQVSGTLSDEWQVQADACLVRSISIAFHFVSGGFLGEVLH